MEIALVYPSYEAHLITPPLGIGYMASFLKKHDHSVKIIDAHNLNLSPEQVTRMCGGVKVAGISCYTAFLSEVTDLSQRLKERGCMVVLGGPHPSALPRETLSLTGADYVVVGEGENALLHIVEKIAKGEDPSDFPGVITSTTEQITRAPLVEDLDSLPFPDWKSIDPRMYRKAPHGGVIKNFPVAPLTTSRGCCFECAFCGSSVIWGRKVRFRSPENVVDEIDYLVRDFGVREIHFEDDNITLKRAHMEQIASLILERRIAISWACPNGVRVESVDRDLLRLMKKSGCYLLAFGIESGNQQILDGIKKNISLETAERAVKMAHEEGIMTQAFFILGLPGETEKTVEETLAYAKRLPLDRAQFLLLDMLPGTALYEEVKGNGGWVLDKPRKSFHQAAWVPPGLQGKELEAMRARAFLSFHLRPRQFLNLAKCIRLSQVPFIIQRLVDYGVLPWRKKRG
jgi:anaerobic magnesium-protoporphyrin IX monomethyl ester cyclase